MNYPDQLSDSLAQLSSLLLAQCSVDGTLQLVADLAVETIEACDAASVTLRRAGEFVSQAVTHQIAAEADAYQCATGEGPCLSAMAERQKFRIDSTAEDERWPAFGPRAAAMRIASCLCLPLVVDDLVGSLNLYARSRGAFGAEDQRVAGLFATQAAFALANAQAFASRTELADQLQQAIESRPLIDQATGVLMEREHVSAQEALELLRQASQNLNTKMREVAQAVLDSVAPEAREESG